MSLDETPIPPGAEERAWRVVSAAFAGRTPTPRHRQLWKPALALAAVAAVAGVVASPPGRAVLDSIRAAVGVERAEPQLFRLPAPGRLLVQSERGLWVVRQDGSRRLLAGFREGSWSPNGLFLAATRPNELLALEPDGDVRWSLPRRSVRFPRWTGNLTDTRIAYLTGSRLHVVAGDGTGDVDAGGLPAAARVAPAWRPGTRVLAYATTRGSVYVYDAERGSLLWRTGPGPTPTKLEWSPDGSRLLVLAPHRLRVYDHGGRVVAQDDPSGATVDVDAGFLPGSNQLAVIRRAGTASNVFLLGTGRSIFRGTGVFSGLAWSPDGQFLLVAWPTADHWVFVRAGGPRRLVAVSSISEQFGADAEVAGWCCG